MSFLCFASSCCSIAVYFAPTIWYWSVTATFRVVATIALSTAKNIRFKEIVRVDAKGSHVVRIWANTQIPNCADNVIADFGVQPKPAAAGTNKMPRITIPFPLIFWNSHLEILFEIAHQFVEPGYDLSNLPLALRLRLGLELGMEPEFTPDQFISLGFESLGRRE